VLVPPPPPSPPPSQLALVSVGATDAEVLDWLASQLAIRLGTAVVQGARIKLRDEWRGREDQYSSNDIVDYLVDRFCAPDDAPSRWVLGVTRADLYAPGRPFVFGEATQGGCCALISTARLQSRPGQGAAGSEVLRARVLKEAIHELGHVAGLVHCTNELCVMAESYDLRETDWKGSNFCPACSPLLTASLPSYRC
jgi:archaemetzincin